MTPHKIFKEIFDLSQDDSTRIEELLGMMRNAKAEFHNVGVPFTYEGFTEWFNRNFEYSIAKNPDWYLPLLKIIEGDNLDKIEDAAIEKGIVPKE